MLVLCSRDAGLKSAIPKVGIPVPLSYPSLSLSLSQVHLLREGVGSPDPEPATLLSMYFIVQNISLVLHTGNKLRA